MGPETTAIDATTLHDRLRAKLAPTPSRAEPDVDIEIESEGVRISRLHRDIEFGEQTPDR